tara:strand:- start:1481 stop:1882 length:402 start_codon:yes stop_codon:yes gene_type:complete
MSRYEKTITNDIERQRAVEWVRKAPVGWRVTLQEPKRSTDQNSRLWAMLSELSIQLVWHGQRLTPEDWKLVMMAGLNQEMRDVPNMNGNGFVQLGRSSSKLSKAEFGELMELIEAFAAEHGVELWPEPVREEA